MLALIFFPTFFYEGYELNYSFDILNLSVWEIVIKFLCYNTRIENPKLDKLVHMSKAKVGSIIIFLGIPKVELNNIFN